MVEGPVRHTAAELPVKTCCGNGTLQKVSRGVLATARQVGQYYAVTEDRRAIELS